MPKKIELNCYGPIAVDKTAECLWEDVYMYWTQKPGRKKKRVWAVLDAKVNIKKDIDGYKRMNEDGVVDVSEEIDEMEEILKEVEKGEIFVRIEDDDYVDIYTPKDFINREEAEKMMTEYLRKIGMNNELRFKWRRTNFIIMPT